MAVKHAKNSAKADGGDSSLVLPSDWNADHVVSVNTVASSGASQTVDIATASVWDITLTANCALTIASSSGLTWLSGAAPVLHSAASAVDVVVFVTQSGGVEKSLTIYLHQDGTGGRTVTWANAGGGTVFYGAQASPPSLAFGSATISHATSRTGVATAFIDITDATVTLTTGAHRLRLTLTGGQVGTDFASTSASLTFSIDGTDVDVGGVGQGLWVVYGSGVYLPQIAASAIYITDVLTAGSHTIKGRLGNIGSNHTARFWSNSTTAGYLFVEELPY